MRYAEINAQLNNTNYTSVSVVVQNYHGMLTNFVAFQAMLAALKLEMK